MGAVTGWSAEGKQVFSSMFYSFTASAGSPCSTDRHLGKRKNATCEAVVVAEKVSPDLFEEPAPLRLYVLQARDESAHGFSSCGYWLSFCVLKSQGNVTVSDGICRKDFHEIT